MGSGLMGAHAARRWVVALCAATLVSGICASSAMAAPASSRAAVPGTAPTWTSGAQVVGAPAGGAPVSFQLVLPLRNAGRGRVAGGLPSPTPRASSYGHYLTAAQFNHRFAPRAAQVRAVEAFLRGQGSGHRCRRQPVGLRDRQRRAHPEAFATTLRTYSYRGRTLRASTIPVRAGDAAALGDGCPGRLPDGLPAYAHGRRPARQPVGPSTP